MIKRYGPYLISAVLFGLLFVLEYYKPKPVSWDPNFQIDQKAPLDLSILYAQKTTWAPQGCTLWPQNPYAYLKVHTTPKSWLYLCADNRIDPVSWQLIMEQIRQGGQLFISCPQMPSFVADSLGVQVKNETEQLALWTPVKVKSRQGWLQSQLRRLDATAYFAITDSSKAKPLGSYQNLQHQSRVNFVYVPYGRGHIWWHTQPQAFSNIALLTQRQSYAEALLAYTPEKPLQWLAYQQWTPKQTYHSLSEIAQQPELRSAQRIGMFLLLLLLVLQTKRRHRRIPVQRSADHAAEAWLGTWAGLYLQKNEFVHLAQVKSQRVFEQIRQKWRVSSTLSPDIWTEQLSKASGVPTADCALLHQLLLQPLDPKACATAKTWLQWYRRVQTVCRKLR